MIRGKNLPNGLLRRATAGTQGAQKSIGNLSNYHPSSHSRERQGAEDMKVSQFAKNNNETPKEYEVNPPAIMSKNKSFTNGSTQGQNTASLNAARATMIKMMKEQGNHQSTHSQANPNIYSQRNQTQITNAGSNFNSSAEKIVPSETVLDSTGKPKMVKSVSQVLGKARQRTKITRNQLMKDINDHQNNIQPLLDAAHATRCTSNEKAVSSSKKPIEAHSFSQKYQNHGQFMNAPYVSSFDLVRDSHSAERTSMENMPDENTNKLNMAAKASQGRPSSVRHSSSSAANSSQQNLQNQ